MLPRGAGVSGPGGLRVEDGYLITDAGAERLSTIPYTVDKVR
jgi:Xaa-Pro aminopeptidase